MEPLTLVSNDLVCSQPSKTPLGSYSIEDDPT